MLTIPNSVYIIIFNIPQTVHIRYGTFWNFSKLLVVLHISAFTKFLLRSGAPCSQCQIKFTSSFSTFRKLYISDIQPFETFRNCCSKMLFVLHILAYTKFLLQWCAPCKPWWTLFKSSFLILCKLGKSDLQCFKNFEIAVCFAHFGYYEIYTPVMRAILTMPNIV